MLLEKSQPTFSDFWISRAGYVSAHKNRILQQGDYVLDKFGIAGVVRNVSEEFGNYIVFIDEYSTYDTTIDIRKITSAGQSIYDLQKRQFSIITKLARILYNTISDFYPYTFIFNNGSDIWVRGSTLSGIVDKFSQKNFTGDNNSLFSAKLSPRYTCEIETLILKKSSRKSWFNRNLIRAILVDIDIMMNESNRIKWKVTDDESYNKPHWKHYIKQYQKWQIKYIGDLNNE